MTAKPFKSPISYPYMEKLFIYDAVNIVTSTINAIDVDKVYYVLDTQKLYSSGASAGVSKNELATSNVNYRFTSIVNLINGSIPFSANVNYLLTGNIVSETTIFTATNALVGTEQMDKMYLGNTLLDVQNGSIIYNSFGKILKLKDGANWSHMSYYLVLPASEL